MKVTTKELRIQSGKIIDHVAHGEEVTVTYRGKALAKIVPINNGAANKNAIGDEVFGMWATQQNQTVDEQVRNLRKGRVF